MRHLQIAAVVTGLLILLVLTADSARSQSESGSVPVRVVTVQPATAARSTTQPATIEAFYRAEIRARATGYVDQVNAEIGDAVAAGDVLAVVSAPEMDQELLVRQAQVRSLEAEVRQAEAGVALAQSEVRASAALLQQVTAEAAAADAQLQADEAEFQRVTDLVSRGSIEPRLQDEARKRRDSSLARQAAARSTITSAEAQVAVRNSHLAAAEAKRDAAAAAVEVVRAEIHQWNTMMAFRQIKAPFDGVITQRTVNPGDLVAASEMKILFAVSQIDRVRCRIAVPERDAAFLNRGDPVRLTLPAFETEALNGTISRTAQSLDPETRTMLIEMDLPNPDGRLLPGMFGQATLSAKESQAVGVLPARAIRFGEDGRPFVYVLTEDARVQVTEVTIGQDNGTHVQVTAGVQPGQNVVDAHLKRFQNGEQVRPVE